MSTRIGPLFAAQRLIFFALLMGMSLYAVVIAAVLQNNDGKGLVGKPIAILDTVVGGVGIGLALAAFLVRRVLQRKLERKDGIARTSARFVTTIVPLAMLEGGCLFALTVWMLNGNPVPSLVTALVLLAMAIYIVPFSDPDAR
ncbi:MAG: hypothetical protein ABIP94_18650 [Planctomycetota bacterium]